MESALSPNTSNVAKIVVDGEKIIRAYGTFPHPNVFSGFLILSIFCGLWFLFLHKQPNTCKNVLPLLANTKIVSRETIGFFWSKLNALLNTMAVESGREAILYAFLIIGIFSQLVAFILTFSRVAWLSAILTVLIFIFLTIKSKLFHVKQFINLAFNKTTIILFLVIIIPLSLFIGTNWKQITSRINNSGNKYQESIDNRSLYNNIAINIVKNHPLTGIGNGNFTLEMDSYSLIPYEWWQYQPAHNIYLLIASELGITGLTLFLMLIYLVIKTSWQNIKNENVSRETFLAQANVSERISIQTKENKTSLTQVTKNKTLLLQIGLISILGGFLFIGLFDHYFWTLKQGQLTFWIILGSMASFKR